jgi:hypothetical protein
VAKPEVPKLPHLLLLVPGRGITRLDNAAVSWEVSAQDGVGPVLAGLMNHPSHAVEVTENVIIKEKLMFSEAQQSSVEGQLGFGKIGLSSGVKTTGNYQWDKSANGSFHFG